MPDAPVLYTVADGVATLALNQPDTRNALSDELLDALLAAFEPDEIRDQLERAGLPGLSVTPVGDRHVTVTGRL